MPARHVAVSISPAARDRVRALTFALTGSTGRRVTMSEAILTACSAADQLSPDQLAALLPEQETAS